MSPPPLSSSSVLMNILHYPHCIVGGGRGRRRKRIERGSAASAPPSLAPVLDKKPGTGLPERKIGSHIEGSFSKILTFADVVLQYDHCTRFVATFINPKGSLLASQSFLVSCKVNKKPPSPRLLSQGFECSCWTADAMKLWIPR